MRDAKPYWTKHPAYLEHWPFATCAHESGNWEAFVVDYKRTLDYSGGKFIEFYWNGDHQESISYSPMSNPSECLGQFIEMWLETEYDWGSPPDQDVPGRVVG